MYLYFPNPAKLVLISGVMQGIMLPMLAGAGLFSDMLLRLENHARHGLGCVSVDLGDRNARDRIVDGVVRAWAIGDLFLL